MPVTIPEKHIEKAITRFQARTKKHAQKPGPARAPKIIALSRDYGTEGRTIGEIIAKKLGFTLWGREILDVLAGQSGLKLQKQMLEALDEKAQGAIDALVADFFGGTERHSYFYLLPKAICTIAQEDVVIVGRGAHLILPQAFRVRIEGSPAVRARAVSALEGIDEKSARQKVSRIDKDRAGFIKQLSTVVPVKPDVLGYDLRINTDRITGKNAAQTIVDVFERCTKDEK